MGNEILIEIERLSTKQQRAIEALLTEPTTRAAAAAAEVSEATIWRWLAEPEFSIAYRAARGRLLESTLTALQSASVDAVVCLREILNDKTAQVSARVSAAKSVLELGLKAREVLEVEERLAYLEKALELKNAKRSA
ncbi:MAG TPA: hypothetical protein PLD20_13930 [Blastocatellia bacterium]|nr:hypothetical protein [Blastocatellia bacterium]HMV83699.1 hypothetical protein [Blastocatellia bacterium]HMX24854.1 hypothetical protein [Blastocatellia bacterium]HMY70885.1 hypothetical protein [Blastocatellia bacterium]HMZ19030.1 hypothetical protein [Blastocatellia bacterium]